MGMLLIIYVAVLIVLLVIPMYYSNYRRNKKMRDLLNSMKIGDEIVTIGGIHGSLVKVNEGTIELKVDKGVILKIEKEAILRVVK